MDVKRNGMKLAEIKIITKMQQLKMLKLTTILFLNYFKNLFVCVSIESKAHNSMAKPIETFTVKFFFKFNITESHIVMH